MFSDASPVPLQSRIVLAGYRNTNSGPLTWHPPVLA